MRKIKAWDKVMVIAGKDKGKISTVLSYAKRTGKKQINKKPQILLLVKGVNMVKRARKGQGFVEFEKPINISNVMFYDEDAKKTSRVAIVDQDGKKKRKLVKTGRILDN